MPHVATDPKQQAHELIDRMSVGQAAAVGLFKALLDSLNRGEGVSHEEILREFGPLA